VRISSVRKGASGATIVADGGSAFIVDLGLLEELGLGELALAPGSELDEREAALVALAAEAREAEARGLALLARAEQSARMLRAKLAARGFGEAATKIAVRRLEEEGLADDRRFARAYAASRLSRRGGREGPASLVAALRGRGIDADTAASAVASVLGPEQRRDALARAAAVALKDKGCDRVELRIRLKSLGFSGNEISEYFEELEEG
jgi:regulatory protein